VSLDTNDLWKQMLNLAINRVFWEEHYAKIEDLDIPYLRDYYYVQYGVYGLALSDVIEAEKANEMIQELIKMRVNAEIDPDDPNNKDTLSDLAEFKKTIRDLKPQIVQYYGVSTKEFEEIMHEFILENFRDDDESEFDSEETQTENHEESLEEDSDIFVDPSQINEDKLYECVVYLFSKRNQVGEEGEVSFLITMTFDNDDYVITLSKSIDSLSRFITIMDTVNNISLVTKRLKTIFDESGDSLIIWDAIKTFNINKSQLKSVYDKEITR
jgi:hypothetical protein